ncbi:hypothetical protein [Labrenzia sp. DG1229]|uniref:hypothetical protein n=1 Tax=Labrenzia sp. DG1229 TaxID=681847 RepID=UPI00048E39E9|nr:hypothetical protein [Labrenzia sp. DG1229]
MANISTAQAKPPLGVGSLIGESFSILFGKFLQVFLVAYGPTLLGLLLSGALLGFGVIAGTAAPDIGGAGSAIAILLTIVISIVTYGITTALLVQLAYDAKLGRQIRLGKYLGPAFAALIPIVILGLVVGVLFMIGLALFVIPGLWIYAVFSVLAPAIVIEKAGFGGLGRSAGLTKEYRWPIVGAILLLILIMTVVELVAGFLIGIVSTIFGSVILDIVLSAALSTFGAGLGSILIALIYARLREIKEGVSVDQIAAVFD